MQDLYGDPLPGKAIARMGTVRLRHFGSNFGQVVSVSFSPDGRWLASGGIDQALRIWDMNTGQPVAAFQEAPRADGYLNGVTSLTFHPAGEWLAYVTPSNEVRFRETGSWRQVRRLDGSLDASAVAVSLDGSLLAIALHGGAVCFWHSVRWESVRFVELDRDFRPIALAFSPDGRTLAVGAMMPAIRLLDVASGRTVGSLDMETGDFPALAFSPDGRLFAFSGEPDIIRLWATASWSEVGQLRNTDASQVYGLGFSPNGSVLASGNSDGVLRFWDVAHMREVRSRAAHLFNINCLCYSRDGTRLASGSGDNVVGLWDAASGDSVFCFDAHVASLSAVAFSRDGTTLTTVGADKTIRLWQADTGVQRQRLDADLKEVWSFTLSTDGQFLSCERSGPVHRVLSTTSRQEVILNTPEAAVGYAAFSPDNGSLCVDCADDRIRIWNLATGERTTVIEGAGEKVRSMAYSHDGRCVAMGLRDGRVVLHSLDAGVAYTLVHTMNKEMGLVFAVGFSPDGRYLGSCGQDGFLCLWDLSSQRQIYRVEEDASAISFSPDGCLLATGGPDSDIRIRDAPTGALRDTLVGHCAGVTAIAFSPDGRLLASGSIDSTALVWELEGD